MKTRSTVFDHDLAYGRDIRIAGVVALVSVIAAFLFAPQPHVAPFRLRAPVHPDFTVIDPGLAAYDPPKPPEPAATRGIPVASDNPTFTTVAPNTGFTEVHGGVTEPPAMTWDFIKVERKPALVRQVAPAYPDMVRAAGIEGRVVVSMVIDTLGNVANAEVYATSDNAQLDRAAVEAAYKCGFTPGFQQDRAVVVRNVIMSFNFKLQ